MDSIIRHSSRQMATSSRLDPRTLGCVNRQGAALKTGFCQPGGLIIPVAGQNGARDSLLEIPPQMSCFPGTPWPSRLPQPALVPQAIPMPLYPAAAYWSIPWIPQLPLPPTVATSSRNSLSLGKHSRDENTGKHENLGKEESSTEDSAEKCLWMPKTLRIDDSKIAVKSSIWATLGVENNKANPVRKPFKAFQPNIEAKRLVAETSAFLQANPAALSRSLNFHDNA